MVRLISGVSLLIFMLVVVYCMPIQVGLVTMGIITFLAVKELLSISKNEIIQKYKYIFAFFASFNYLVNNLFGFYNEIMIIIPVVCLFLVYLVHHEKINYEEIFFMTTAIVVLPYAINCITSIYMLENGEYLILIPMIASWASDSLAYFVGKNLGKHKLAPKISPNKTVEGSIGGILGGIIGMLIFGFITNSIIGIPVLLLVIIGGLGSIIGQIGDLCFSMMKRQTGIKDYSNLIPGHGGILDRFDSIIFNAPIALALLKLVI